MTFPGEKVGLPVGHSEMARALDRFHVALGYEPGCGNAKLRITLHEEEGAELIGALYALHFSQIFGWAGPVRDRARREALARELADVVFLAYGTAHAFDIDLDVALAEVHRAAMSKLDPRCPSCGGDGEFLWGDGPCVECGGSGKIGRVVREDGKVMKPPGFVPPDMSEAVR